jgi:hypothetical protein
VIIVAIDELQLDQYLETLQAREINGYCGVGVSPKYSPNVILEIRDKIKSGEFVVLTISHRFYEIEAHFGFSILIGLILIMVMI